MGAYDQMLSAANPPQQPDAGVPQPVTAGPGMADVVSPQTNPLVEMQKPAASPEDLMQRKLGWQKVLEHYNSNPSLQNAVGIAAAKLAQPLQFGQSATGNLAGAIQSGQAAYNAGEYSQYEQARTAQADVQKAAESASTVRANNARAGVSEAQTPGIRAASDVATATVQTDIKKARADSELAITKAAAAKDTEEVNKLQREEAKRVANLRKGISDKTLLAEIQAEHDTVMQKLEVEKQRVATLKAQAGQAAAGAAEHKAGADLKQLTIDEVKAMPPEEKKQFLTKTGKYSATTSGVGQQAQMWGDIYDKLPTNDPSKAGKTKEQFQMDKLTSAKQKDVVDSLTKYLQAGGEDQEIIQGLTDLVKGQIGNKKASNQTSSGKIVRWTRDASGKPVPVAQ